MSMLSPGGPRRRLLVVALVVIAIAAVALGGWSRRHRDRRRLRIATGQLGGTFLPLGEALAAAFVVDVPRLVPTVLPSPGSEASVQMLERGEVELALISNNARPGRRGSLIAPLYPETLQIVVRKAAKIARIDDLAGKALSVGPSGSGTETIAWQVLGHFGLGRGRVAAVNLTPLEAAARLEAGTLDAVFVVAGVRAPVVARLLARGDLELLSLGDPDERGGTLDGIRVDAPYLLTSVIPARAYGTAPAQRIGTVGVKALLVARKDLDPDLVYALAASLFAAKARLVEKEQLLAGLSEKVDPTESPFPLHPGADRYLRREDPSLLEKYTDQISLALTIGALLWSAAAGLRAWRRQRQRGRIETYFGRVAALTVRVRRGGSDADVRQALVELEELELGALGDLGAERLEAGPAFRVLQEAVRGLHHELARRLGRDDADTDPGAFANVRPRN